jgi:hypothetical protein
MIRFIPISLLVLPAGLDLVASLQARGGVLRSGPDTQEVAAPKFPDIDFGVTAAKQFSSDVDALTFVVPTNYAAAVIEIGRNACSGSA